MTCSMYEREWFHKKLSSPVLRRSHKDPHKWIRTYIFVIELGPANLSAMGPEVGHSGAPCVGCPTQPTTWHDAGEQLVTHAPRLRLSSNHLTTVA